MPMTENQKERLNTLRGKENRTDAEDKELRALEDKDEREEVPAGTTTERVNQQISESASGSESPSPSEEVEEEEDDK
jgi:hypothetical protein